MNSHDETEIIENQTTPEIRQDNGSNESRKKKTNHSLGKFKVSPCFFCFRAIASDLTQNLVSYLMDFGSQEPR